MRYCVDRAPSPGFLIIAAKIRYASRQPLPGRNSVSLIRSLRFGLDARILSAVVTFSQETALVRPGGKEVMANGKIHHHPSLRGACGNSSAGNRSDA